MTVEPSRWLTGARAVLPAVPVLSRLPGVRRSGRTLPAVERRLEVPVVDRRRVAAYAEVCGLRPAEDLPLLYPHVLASDLHLAVLTHPDFPFPAVGTVHVADVVTRHRRLPASEPLMLTVRAERLRPHPRGRAFDLVTEAVARGERVWEERSTMLHRGPGDPDADRGPALDEVPVSPVTWRLPGDLGRRYAAVSGDANPIHLYAVTARLFGFRRPIAHGMWSAARCLAALEGRLPDAVRVDVVFRRPVELPGAVRFGSCRSGAGYAFALTAPDTGSPHLVGRTGPLDDGV